jgi:hypothetical protein
VTDAPETSIPEALAGTDPPWVVFFSSAKCAKALAAVPGWTGFTGAERSDERVEAIKAFNAGKFQGISLTYAAGAMGIRFPNAKTKVFVGTVDPDTMAQASHRAPQAKTVLL